MNTQGIVQFDGSSSDLFPVRSRAKQGCVLASTQFCIFSRGCCLSDSQRTECIFHTGSDDNFFRLVGLRAKTKVWRVLIREMLFADDVALTTHSEKALQLLINCFIDACSLAWLSAPEEEQHPGPRREQLPKYLHRRPHTRGRRGLHVYLGSTISSNPFQEAEPKATKASAPWHEDLRQPHADHQHQEAGVPSVLSTLLHGSVLWFLYSRQYRRLTIFDPRNLKRNLRITL